MVNIYRYDPEEIAIRKQSAPTEGTAETKQFVNDELMAQRAAETAGVIKNKRPDFEPVIGHETVIKRRRKVS